MNCNYFHRDFFPLLFEYNALASAFDSTRLLTFQAARNQRQAAPPVR